MTSLPIASYDSFMNGPMQDAITIMTPILMAVIIFVIIRAGMALPKRAKKPVDAGAAGVNVRFDDIAGIDEVKGELKEVVDFLQNPDSFSKHGAKIPRGFLMSGPPGTGKTMLAKAVATESGAAFFPTSGSEFTEMYVGLGALRVRQLFAGARKTAAGGRPKFLGIPVGKSKPARPAIIFIDEIDAVGKKRGSGDASGEQSQTLNQLLVEMDGFSTENVIVIAASNLPESLDSALLRPGRFDRQVLVSAPDLKGRIAILGVHTKGKPLATDVNLHKIAQRTAGLAGADLANLINEAAIIAGRAKHEFITQEHFEEAQERIIAGAETKHVLSDEEKRIVAYHEAGHALTSELLPNLPKVHKISIIPRGKALGYALNLPDSEQDRFLQSKGELEDMLVMLLGGRAAEQVVFNSVTTGPSNDLERVSAIVKSMVTNYAFGEGLGVQAVPTGDYSISEQTRRTVDEQQYKLSTAAWESALKMVNDHRGVLDALAEKLLANEVLERDEIVAITSSAREAAGITAAPSLTKPAPITA